MTAVTGRCSTSCSPTQSCAPQWRRAPCTRGGHHAYLGGLLEHTVAVATLAHETCQLHPRLNSDLLLTAALVHDLGRTREFTYGAEIGLSEEGRLLGHLVIGERIARRASCRADASTSRATVGPAALCLVSSRSLLSARRALCLRRGAGPVPPQRARRHRQGRARARPVRRGLNDLARPPGSATAPPRPFGLGVRPDAGPGTSRLSKGRRTPSLRLATPAQARRAQPARPVRPLGSPKAGWQRSGGPGAPNHCQPQARAAAGHAEARPTVHGRANCPRGRPARGGDGR